MALSPFSQSRSGRLLPAMRAPLPTCVVWAVAGVLCCGAVASGCGGGATKKSASAAPVSRDQFDPANFGNPATGANRWDPMLPGRQSVREGRVNVGHRRLTHRRVYSVTNL